MISDLLDMKFETLVIGMFNELEGRFHELSKNFNREIQNVKIKIKNIKRNQSEVKNTIIKIKNIFEKITDQMKANDPISNLKDKLEGNTIGSAKRKKNF